MMKNVKTLKLMYPSLIFLGLLFLGSTQSNATTVQINVKQDTLKPNNQSIKNTDDVFEKTDTPAQPLTAKGISDIRREYQKEFNVNNIKNTGAFKTVLSFIVEKDGTISEIKATGDSEVFNKESERAFKKINTKIKWKPGLIKDQPVRSKYHFPITMTFG